MPVWIPTGKLGSGKTLLSVQRIQKYLLEGRKVATNLDIYPEKMLGLYKKHTELYRLPDIPTIDDFLRLPRGYEGDEIDESKNGLLVLDETGIFLDSRGWNNPERKKVNAFFKLLRKLRWDAILIIQDVDNLDSDARRTIAEHVVYCRRMDRMRIPYISALIKSLTGIEIPLPKLHIGIVLYGTEASSMKVDQWTYYGTGLYSAYNTEQLFSETENHGGIHGLTTILPSYYTHGRYITTLQRIKNAIRDYKVKGTHFFSIGAFVAAFAVNALVTAEPEIPKKGIWSCNDAYKAMYGSCEAEPYLKPALPVKTDKPKSTAPATTKTDLYLAGWQRKGDGSYDLSFVDSTGAPYYPLTYRVRIMGDCVAMVMIEGREQKIVCMPDDLAYKNQPVTATVAQTTETQQ